jgi:nucleotide-binding universal stress UspA family protein
MKSLLLHVGADDGQTTRLNAAIALAQTFNAHLRCVQATPLAAFAMFADPFNASFDLPAIYEAVREAAEDERRRIEDRLRNEAISWEWLQLDEPAGSAIIRQAKLADLVVLSRPDSEASGTLPPAPIAADVAIHSHGPVLAVPVIDERFDCAGPALVAWNGSFEAAHALRMSLPLLHRAATVHVVTVAEEPSEPTADEACQYLARHGIAAERHQRTAGEGEVAQALVDAALEVGAGYMVIGAYGHSRVRETILGGVTRDLLHGSPIALLMAQ